MSDTPAMVGLGENYRELREAVGKICERYPGEYWHKPSEVAAFRPVRQSA